jgi:lysophospholipase L1-like esterase
MKSILSFLFFLCFSFANAQQQKIRPPLRFLALGDSYTIGQSVTVNARWPVQLKDSLISRGLAFDTLKIIATTGWRTDNLISAINSAKPDSSFNLVSILIGVNNQYQGANIANYVPDLTTLINRAIALAGNDTAAIFLVSIPDYAYTPYGQGTSDPSKISREIDRYNHLMDSVAQIYGINYFYITAISRQVLNDPALVANDGLHPSGKMYTRFVNEILDSIQIESFQKVQEINQAEIKILQRDDTLEVFSSDKIFSMDVFDMEGRLVFSQSGQQGYHVWIPLIYLEKGSAYILSLKTKDGKKMATKKIVLR